MGFASICLLVLCCTLAISSLPHPSSATSINLPPGNLPHEITMTPGQTKRYFLTFHTKRDNYTDDSPIFDNLIFATDDAQPRTPPLKQE